MPTTTRTVRVFVSSTFEDLKEERNVLQEKVFPKLEQFCLEKGARFQAIDLRWGVREEAGLDQKTMEICLSEIARCQKTRIKPNFIVLLGDRYGWRPLPARIQRDEFEAVLAHIVETGERDFVRSWYDLDLNADPPEYLLKPRKGIYTDWTHWEPEELRIHRAAREGARAAGLPGSDLIKYEASATRQEILKGLGESADDCKHVFAFFREPHGPEDPDLKKLKEHLKAQLPKENVFSYPAGDHAQLCDDVESSLRTVIAATAGRFESRNEKASHDRFADDRAKHFKGREAVLDAIERYLHGDDKRPLVVYGPSGSGKSAIMAVASMGKNAIRRFIGATPDSSSGITLLRSLCRELGERFGQTGDLPATFNELSSMFSDRLRLATAEQPVILFIDALDQLSAQDPAATMRWLPAELPPYCHTVLSTTEIPAALQGAAIVSVEPLPVLEAGLALDAWFTEARRTLRPDQREKLLASFLKSGLPLYLKLAFEEARLWRSFDPRDECVLGDGLPGIIDRLLARLSGPVNHGQILVSHALGYLTAARYGLTEDEILAVLTKDDIVWKDVVGEGERRRHDPPLRQLPVIVWSRLYLDLEPYLTERTVPGGTTVSFYHRQLAERVKTTPLHHNILATHFDGQPYWLGANVPNQRKLTELVRQQVGAGLLDDAEAVLTDLDFVSAKCAAELLFDLEDDYRAAIAALPEAQAELREEERRQAELARWAQTLIECAEKKRLPKPEEILKSAEPWSNERMAAESNRIAEHPTSLDRLASFAEFVEGERHLLTRWAGREGFTLQQAFNHAPSGPVHDAARASIGRPEVHLLLRRWSPKATWNPKPVLRRTLEMPCGTVFSVSATPDGRLVVAGCLDGAVVIADMNNGAIVGFLEGHNDGPVMSVCVTPDGRRAVSGGTADQALRVWDLERRTCLRTLEVGIPGKIEEDFGKEVVASMTADGRRAVSGSCDGVMQLWDLENGDCLHILEGHRGPVTCASLTPDGQRAVTGGEDGTLRVWDLENGTCLHILEGALTAETKRNRRVSIRNVPVTSLSLTSDSRRAVTGGNDGMLRVWDLESGACLHILEGLTGPANSASVTPDGRVAVALGDNGTLGVWDLQSATMVRRIERREVYAACVTPDGRHAVSGSHDGALRLWDLESGAETAALETEIGGVESLTVTPDGRLAVSGSADRTVRVWDVEMGACLHTFKGPSHSVSVSSDGSRAVSASGQLRNGQLHKDTAIYVWDLRSGACHTLEGHTDNILSVSITPNGRLAVSGSTDCTVRVWDLTNGICMHTLEGHSKLVTCVSVMPDGRRAVSGSSDATLRVWDLRSGTCLRTLEGGIDQIHCVSVTPDGRHAVVGGNHSVQVWDLKSGASLRTLKTEGAWICSVCVTPDGQYIINGSVSDTLQFWDFDTGSCLAQYFEGATIGKVVVASTPTVLVAGTKLGLLFLDMNGLPGRTQIAGSGIAPELSDPEYETILRKDLEYCRREKGPFHEDALAHVVALTAHLPEIAETDEFRSSLQEYKRIMQERKEKQRAMEMRSEPAERRSAALQAYRTGDYSHAEILLRSLIADGFEVPSTHCHLGRTLLMQDRFEEAATETSTAWEHRDEASQYVVPRILWLQLALRYVSPAKDTGMLSAQVILARLVSALAREDAHQEWTMDPVLLHLQSRLPDGQHQFLAALVGALSDETNVSTLQQFAAWRTATLTTEQGSVCTSIPFPHPVADPDRAARLNIEYLTALNQWKALSWWKRLRTKRPEPPTGI